MQIGISMKIEIIEKKLYDACLEGDVETLEALMKEDKLTLARVSLSSCFNQTPLHLASMLGHFEFAKSLLSYKPDFSSAVDLQGRSALHLASANGYADIVEILLKYDQKMCHVCDEDGRTPIHLAIMKGQQESVSELLKVNSESDQKGKLLHLCVVYNRLNVFVLILESTDQDLLNIKDDNGDTILHSAAALRRMQIINYLVKCRSDEVNVNVLNENGLTALDILEEIPKDVKTTGIKEFLISAGALTSTGLQLVPGDNLQGPAAAAATASNSKFVKMWKKVKNFTIFQEKMEKRDETLLIAASVIAAMAYQAAISPPGGVAGVDATEFQRNYTNSPNFKKYDLEPASSLLSYFYEGLNNGFWLSNTISFMAALCVIFIYVSGASLKQRIFVWVIRAAMWITLTSMTAAYVCAVVATSPDYAKDIKKSFKYNRTIFVLVAGLFAWIAMMIFAVLVVVYRSIRYIRTTIKKHRSARKKKHIRGRRYIILGEEALTPSTGMV